MANEIQFQFNSQDLDSGDFSIGDISVKENKTIKVTDIPRSQGSVVETAKRKSLTISVEGQVRGDDVDDLRDNLDTLRAALQDGIQKFTMDDDRYVNAQMSGFDYSFVTMRTLANIKASFLAHYPFWLAADETTDVTVPTSEVGYVVNNPGNAPTRIKVEITAPGAGIDAGNCQLANTSTGELFRYIETIAAGDILKVDNRYDTDDYIITNDGANAHVDFEGDLITLDPGDNTIVFTGTADTSVKLYWRGAWY
jgi:phage-related protein